MTMKYIYQDGSHMIQDDNGLWKLTEIFRSDDQVCDECHTHSRQINIIFRLEKKKQNILDSYSHMPESIRSIYCFHTSSCSHYREALSECLKHYLASYEGFAEVFV